MGIMILLTLQNSMTSKLHVQCVTKLKKQTQMGITSMTLITYGLNVHSIKRAKLTRHSKITSKLTKIGVSKTNAVVYLKKKMNNLKNSLTKIKMAKLKDL